MARRGSVRKETALCQPPARGESGSPIAPVGASAPKDVGAIRSVACAAVMAFQDVDDLTMVSARLTGARQHFLPVSVHITCCSGRGNSWVCAFWAGNRLSDRRPVGSKDPTLDQRGHCNTFRLRRHKRLIKRAADDAVPRIGVAGADRHLDVRYGPA